MASVARSCLQRSVLGGERLRRLQPQQLDAAASLVILRAEVGRLGKDRAVTIGAGWLAELLAARPREFIVIGGGGRVDPAVEPPNEVPGQSSAAELADRCDRDEAAGRQGLDGGEVASSKVPEERSCMQRSATGRSLVGGKRQNTSTSAIAMTDGK